MRTSIFLLAASVVLASPAVAKETTKKPTTAELQNAQQTLSLLVSALNSKEVPQETKNGLFGCLYQNSLGAIAGDSAAVLQKNKQIDRKNPNARLLVLAKICGAPVPAGKSDAGDKPKGR